MGANSKIEWTDHTFNPWTGCLKVSPGCDNCYAADIARRAPRTFGSWLPGAPRKRTSESYWRQPHAWNRKAEREGVRRRVFCSSMADVFDNQVPEAWRQELWRLIDETPHLTWLLLTKRPQNIAKMLPYEAGGHTELIRSVWGKGRPNVWLGTTVENQEEANRRIPHLLAVPAAKHFLSCEPLLGPLDLSMAPAIGRAGWLRPLTGDHHLQPMHADHRGARIAWVICGGESGTKARPMHPAWARSLRDQCAGSGVPFFFKQWGEYQAARPVYPAEDQTWSKFAAERAFGPGTSPDEVDFDGCEGVEDFMREFPALGVLYRDGLFYDGLEYQPHVNSGCWWMERVGKKSAGALLDGREHREVPHG